MVALREYLARFRVVAAPGAPVRGAPSVDGDARRDAELEPVFASLDDAEAEARGILDRAADEAVAIRTEGTRRAEAIVQEALDRAPDERDRVARRLRLEADEYCAAVLDDARERTESMRTRAEPLVETFAAGVVAAVAARLRASEPGAVR